ncbi:hypothetical protein BD410DRAFT_801460 [Rickenella mellea]|uniref:Uncharacterized protein n=1 Tax=Rickenella mellea TaxID=50990 RepID=A0A4Y7QCM2_9AGAM|nr:hypothetical protein BD410DRAFT_801460 [Rickenella mellea]
MDSTGWFNTSSSLESQQLAVLADHAVQKFKPEFSDNWSGNIHSIRFFTSYLAYSIGIVTEMLSYEMHTSGVWPPHSNDNNEVGGRRDPQMKGMRKNLRLSDDIRLQKYKDEEAWIWKVFVRIRNMMARCMMTQQSPLVDRTLCNATERLAMRGSEWGAGVNLGENLRTRAPKYGEADDLRNRRRRREAVRLRRCNKPEFKGDLEEDSVRDHWFWDTWVAEDREEDGMEWAGNIPSLIFPWEFQPDCRCSTA